MSRPVCDCGHEKKDHVMPSTAVRNYGQCKICLCDVYARKVEMPPESRGEELLVQSS